MPPTVTATGSHGIGSGIHFDSDYQSCPATFSRKDEAAMELGDAEMNEAEEEFIHNMMEESAQQDHHAEEWEAAMAEVEYQVVTTDFTDELDSRSTRSRERYYRQNNELDEDEYERVALFQEASFSSEEMQMLLRNLEEPEFRNVASDMRYKPRNIFPDWLLRSREWKTTKARKDNDQDVSEILHIPPGQRSAEQQSVLVQWIMSVWQTAKIMGIKKCNAMLSEFKYAIYEPETDIIVEGESGMTFYILISGETVVIKNGIGIVAKLGQGKSFGELALTKGDVRTATIRTVTRCEVLSLHKLDYDHFVKDIQLAERREHFFLMRECSLFAKWTRTKVDKLVSTCTRKIFEAGACIFKQGDEPDRVYIVMDGVVEIIKEVHIVCKNRWPTDLNEWKHSAKQTIKPIRVSILRRADYFGELSIVRNTVRAASAFAITKCTLVTVDKLEFMHLVNHSKTSELEPLTRQAKAYPSDSEIIAVIGHISGGPQTEARLGSVVIQPNKIEKLAAVDRRAASRIGERKTSKKKGKGLEGKPPDAGSPQQGHRDLRHLDVEAQAKLSYNLVKLGNVLRDGRQESHEVKAAREEDQLIAADIEAANKHAPVDANPLLAMRIPAHKSISLVARPKAKPGPSDSPVKENAGLGNFAASMDPVDRVIFSNRVMEEEKPRWMSLRIPQELPLNGVVVAVKRVPTGTYLRRLGTSQSLDALTTARRIRAQSPKLPLLRPGTRVEPPKGPVSTRDFIRKSKLSYHDAIYREASSLTTPLAFM